MNERHNAIIDTLSQRDRATVKELSDLTGVSVVTIRQDLTLLERDGFLRRVHGGATLLETDSIARRLSIRYEQKLAIARKAAALVEEGETVLIESGSANAILARELAGRRVQIVAANLFVARQIKPGDAATVAVLGGMYQPDSEALVGALAKLGVRETFFSKAFLGVDGFTQASGFTNRDMMRAEIGAEIISRGVPAYVVGDSSKFGRTGLARVCGLDELAGVITDTGLPHDFAAAVKASKAKLVLA
ncbi:MAG: DeoR/GlpR family DNA-binding transcription regulator [Planctomycetes bacterium]|nr:DeoR/GlpR family DNA-binding transcription regulator [Planctomycetota bacterium]